MLDNQSKMRSMLDLLEAVDQGKKITLNESSHEQLSELSADTLRSYINKSKGDLAKYDQAGDVAYHEKGDVKLANKMYKKGDIEYVEMKERLDKSEKDTEKIKENIKLEVKMCWADLSEE
jgi:hypothetical protein